MINNRPHSSLLPPLKWRCKENGDEQFLLLSSEDLSISSSSTQQLVSNSVVELENEIESSSVKPSEGPETLLSVFRFDELSPRSQADFVLQEALNVIRKAKRAENDPAAKELDELIECARNQVGLLILRDCCVRLVEGNKFVERLKYLCVAEEEFVKQFSATTTCTNITSVALNENELLNLTENIQMHSKPWFFVEGRLKSCKILHPLDEMVDDQIHQLKIKFNYFIYEALIRIQKLLKLIVKSLVLLDSRHSITNQNHRSTWRAFVEVCEKYNDVCTNYATKDTDAFLKHFSLERILRLVAKECAILGLDLFYDTLIEPLKKDEARVTRNVEWITENSAVSQYQSTLGDFSSAAKGEPYENDQNQNQSSLQDGDLVTRLLLCVYDSSNLVSTSLCFKNGETTDQIVKGKAVHFESNVSQPFWMDFYVKMLRKEILNGLEIKWISCANEFGSVVYWSDSMLLAVAAHADELAQNVDAVDVSAIYRKVAVSLKLRAALAAWDERLCAALPACLNHRFPQKLTSKNKVVTQAAHCLLSALEPLFSLFPTFQFKEDNCWQQTQTLIVPCLYATLSLVHRWLANSTNQLLATWQLDAYLLITHSDLKHIVDLLKHISTINCPSFISSMTPSTAISTRFHMYQMSELWEDVNKMSSKIQNIASLSTQKFYRKCWDMSSKAFETHMPVGNAWRKKYRSNGPPNTHSDYIDNIIADVLEPVLEGVKNLSMPVQISVVSVATKAFCESWMLFICKNKIKFSLHGALLFRLDVVHLSLWLRSIPELSIEAQQSIQALDVLRRLHGSSLLLTRQPRSHQQFRKTKVSPLSTIADLNLDISVEELSVDDLVTDEDYVPNKDEWLALRAHGNSAGWHFLWCLARRRE